MLHLSSLRSQHLAFVRILTHRIEIERLVAQEMISSFGPLVMEAITSMAAMVTMTLLCSAYLESLQALVK